MILRFLFSGELIPIPKFFESFIYTFHFISFLHRFWNTWNALITVNERRYCYQYVFHCWLTMQFSYYSDSMWTLTRPRTTPPRTRTLFYAERWYNVCSNGRYCKSSNNKNIVTENAKFYGAVVFAESLQNLLNVVQRQAAANLLDELRWLSPRVHSAIQCESKK